MKIGELAKRTGLAASTIRFYESKGLLSPERVGDEVGDQITRKIGDIEAMERRLAQNKAQLHSLIALIDAKPEGMACEDNAARVMDSVGLQAPRKTGK